MITCDTFEYRATRKRTLPFEALVVLLILIAWGASPGSASVICLDKVTRHRPAAHEVICWSRVSCENGGLSSATTA